ncbi:MAG: hypothetical protein NUV67_01630 [archaeon]|nr:hypothetical protein [archaeon]
MKIAAILLILIIAISGCSDSNSNGQDLEPKNPENPPQLDPVESEWDAIRANNAAQFSPEWGTPVLAGISTNNWEDSAFISGDGQTLYFTYYPGDITADMAKLEFKDDFDIFYSPKPFTQKFVHPISKDIWSEAGAMISGGDIYYMSNFLEQDEIGVIEANDNIYKNSERLPFNTLGYETDPHYCAAQDELYYWVTPSYVDFKPGDIYVYKDGKSTLLGPPINTDAHDLEPFLTKDCQTMYFTSHRNGKGEIFVSKRLGEFAWQEPSLVATSPFGVGKATLTDDGEYLFFVQGFSSALGANNADILYVQRKAN